MKKVHFSLSVVISLICFSGFSQTAQNLDYRGAVVREYVIKRSNEAKGNPFLYNEWNRGMIVLNDSVFSKQDKIQYDAFDNKVLVKNERSNTVMEIYDKSLTGFSIIDKNRIKHDFVRLKNENFVDNVDEGFFEIIFNLENKNYLIKKTSKELFDPNRSKGSQTSNNFPLEYRSKITYYIKNKDAQYVKILLKKKDVKRVLSGNSIKINAFVKKNKIKFNKEKDVARLANFYYST